MAPEAHTFDISTKLDAYSFGVVLLEIMTGVYADHCKVSVSAQDGIVAFGKARTRSAPSLSSLPEVALETVPIFVWFNADRSRAWRVDCRPLPHNDHWKAVKEQTNKQRI